MHYFSCKWQVLSSVPQNQRERASCHHFFSVIWQSYMLTSIIDEAETPFSLHAVALIDQQETEFWGRCLTFIVLGPGVGCFILKGHFSTVQERGTLSLSVFLCVHSLCQSIGSSRLGSHVTPAHSSSVSNTTEWAHDLAVTVLLCLTV